MSLSSAPSLRQRVWLATRYAMRFRQIIWQGSAFFESAQNAHVLRDLLIESGPLFVKLGQWMSQRPDLFSKEFTDVLAELQTRVPAHGWSDTEAALKRIAPHLENPAEQLFERMDREALASGSVAQVYRGRARQSVLKQCQRRIDDNAGEDGNGGSDDNGDNDDDDDDVIDVIVKVRHPNARKEFTEGLEALSVLFALGRWCGVVVFSILRFEEMARDMMAQLDLRKERTAMCEFRRNFARNAYIRFPTPLLWSEEVLVETYEEGIGFEDVGTDRDGTVYLDDNERTLCRELCKQLTLASYLQMALHDGIIHGDCHNGNLLYRIERKSIEELEYEHQTAEMLQEDAPTIYPFRVKVCFIDFGIVLRFSEAHRRNHLRIMINVHAAFGAEVAECMRELMIASDQYDERAYKRFKVDCIACMDALDQREREENGVPMSVTMQSIMDLLHKYRLVIDATTARMMIGFILIEQGRSHTKHDNISENTMRWILFEDAGANFPLVPHIGNVLGAKVTRQQTTPVGALPPILDPTIERDVHQAKEEALRTMEVPLDCLPPVPAANSGTPASTSRRRRRRDSNLLPLPPIAQTVAIDMTQ